MFLELFYWGKRPILNKAKYFAKIQTDNTVLFLQQSLNVVPSHMGDWEYVPASRPYQQCLHMETVTFCFINGVWFIPKYAVYYISLTSIRHQNILECLKIALVCEKSIIA